MRLLERAFYERPVLEVARDLIGCSVEHAGSSGVIVETEAYHHSEPACHAFVGLTQRTSVLFGEPGRAYVYRSYGIHAMLNAVCEPAGVGAAVLIRALEPSAGIEAMRARRAAGAARGGTPPTGRARERARAALRDEDLCSGPGKLAQALGVTLEMNGTSLRSGPMRFRARAGEWLEPEVITGTRIGISRAAELPWRFCAAGCGHVSRPHPAPARPPASGASGGRRGAARAAGAGGRRRA